MLTNREQRWSALFATALALPLLIGCGSDDSGTGPRGGGDQTVSATASPSSATLAQGGSTTTTIVFTVTGGLTIGRSFTINRPLDGISLNQVSSETSGSMTITQVQQITVDNTVPPGTYAINFSTPVEGYVNGNTGPTHALATFTLTVTP